MVKSRITRMIFFCLSVIVSALRKPTSDVVGHRLHVFELVALEVLVGLDAELVEQIFSERLCLVLEEVSHA